MTDQPNPNGVREQVRTKSRAFLEIGLIFLVFFLYGVQPTPGVNEAQYLAKAKHFWNPAWCPGDHFLGSADAHWAFFWSTGWLTRWMSLSAYAWLGRLVTWWAMATAWRRLSLAVVPCRWASLVSATLFLLTLHHCHMMGEWVVGGIEGKSVAYVLVFFGLGSLVKGRWNETWLLMGLAALFHVLVGGWSCVATAAAWIASGKERPALASMLPGIGCGFGLALAGIVPAWSMTQGVDAEIIEQANHIYVFERLAHHLVIHLQSQSRIAAHFSLVVVWLLLLWPTFRETSLRRIHGFVAGALGLTIVGIVIDQATLTQPDVAARLLRYYWYRLGDVAVPLGVGLSAVFVLHRFAAAPLSSSRKLRSVLVVVCLLGLVITRQAAWRDGRPEADMQAWPVQSPGDQKPHKKYRDWRNACHWISEHTFSTDRFLTPLRQQTFKWYSGRSEVVIWKDIPQDAKNVVIWWQRIEDLHQSQDSSGTWHWNQSLAEHSEERLVCFAGQFGCHYLVVDRSDTAVRISPSRLVYPNHDHENESFAIYRVDQTRE